jgi:hypothetical protein
MKIVQLLTGLPTTITNEELKFIKHHRENIAINSLDEHDQWVAQNLVRKGVYSISKDSRTLVNNLNEDNT